MKLMRMSVHFYLIILACFCACSAPVQEVNKLNTSSLIPSLDELSGAWVSVDTVDMEPSIRNFRAQALVNDDMASISWLASAPYAGGYHTGTLRVNGETPIVTHWRWKPYQALRRSVGEKMEINSSTRMVVDQNTVLWTIEIKNTSDQTQEYDTELDQIGFISKYPDQEWQWWYPYPTLDGQVTKRDDVIENMREYIGTGQTSADMKVVELINGQPTETMKKAVWPSSVDLLASQKHGITSSDNQMIIADTETDAISGFQIITPADQTSIANSGGTSTWSFALKPGESKTIQYAMSWGDSAQEVSRQLTTLSANFTAEWNGIETEWDRRWLEIFKPNNEILSAAFPTLESDDKEANRVYYTGPLTMLYLMNTNLPQHDKVFLTGGPRWGATITFFWDITEWATLWAVVDPQMMKEHLTAWVDIDPSKHFGKDNFHGEGAGNGYSANYWALFQMMRAYVTVSGDEKFLSESIKGKTVLEHLEHYATNWQGISIYEEGMDDTYKLADFGDDEWNLLEAVPTYKHIVPSFNAGYVWMMRETAAFHRLVENEKRADELDAEAKLMIKRILNLYAGNGVWNSLYPDGSKVEVRHCLDFMFLGRYLPEDIPADIKSEMMEFVYRELMTDQWMRAQSQDDIAAEDSDRPDHGPLGAFDGWPAGTMDALVQLGFPDKALDFYHNIEPVTAEGIWAQAHEIWGEDKWKKNGKVRIAKRGWHNRESSSGIAMSQVMLKNFFGFYPTVDGKALKPNKNWTFKGKLYHVKYKDKYYTLDSTGDEVTMIEE